MDKDSKMHVLKMVRGDIGEDAFRSASAAIHSMHFIEMMHNKGKRISRVELMTRVNLSLLKYSCEPVSYGFFRKFI